MNQESPAPNDPNASNETELSLSLHESEKKYRQLFESMTEGFLLLGMVYDEAGVPISYRYLDANPALEQLTHLKRDRILGKDAREVLPGIEPHWIEAFGRVATTGEPNTIEQYSKDLGGWYRIDAYRTAPATVALIYSNITERKRTQAELEKTSRELQSLADNAPDVVGRVDRELRYLFVNRVISDYTGIAPTDYIGKTNEELGHPPELCRLWSDTFKKVFDTGQTHEIGFSFPSPKGAANFQSRAVPEFGSDGGVETVMFIARDVTKLKLAEGATRESEQRFRIMADETPVMIWAHRSDGTIEFVNRAWCDFFGVTVQEAKTHGWQPLVHPDDAEAYASEFSLALKEMKPFHAEARAKRYDGQWRWVVSYGNPRFSASGEFLGIVGSSPDITERKQAEEMLRTFNQALEKRVIERTSEVLRQAGQLRALASRLKYVEQRERKRLSKMVHDHIQQYLVAAQMRLESVNRDIQPGILQDTVEALKAILSDVLEASRNLVSELSPAALRKAGLIGGLDWLAQRMQEQHDFTVRIESDSDAEPDSEEMQLLVFEFVRELLLNTVKHADTRYADVTLTRSGDSEIKVVVCDSGNGFNPNLMSNPRVLESGFGLFGIRERLSHLGGSMEVESNPGKGTQITLTIPDPADDFLSQQ